MARFIVGYINLARLLFSSKFLTNSISSYLFKCVTYLVDLLDETKPLIGHIFKPDDKHRHFLLILVKKIRNKYNTSDKQQHEFLLRKNKLGRHNGRGHFQKVYSPPLEEELYIKIKMNVNIFKYRVQLFQYINYFTCKFCYTHYPSGNLKYRYTTMYQNIVFTLNTIHSADAINLCGKKLLNTVKVDNYAWRKFSLVTR